MFESICYESLGQIINPRPSISIRWAAHVASPRLRRGYPMTCLTRHSAHATLSIHIHTSLLYTYRHMQGAHLSPTLTSSLPPGLFQNLDRCGSVRRTSLGALYLEHSVTGATQYLPKCAESARSQFQEQAKRIDRKQKPIHGQIRDTAHAAMVLSSSLFKFTIIVRDSCTGIYDAPTLRLIRVRVHSPLSTCSDDDRHCATTAREHR